MQRYETALGRHVACLGAEGVAGGFLDAVVDRGDEGEDVASGRAAAVGDPIGVTR